MTLPVIAFVLLGLSSAGIGAFGGIGGATLLVPVLLILGVSPLDAAPLGLLSVGAGSLAAAARQLDEGLVHHRLGLSVELTASVGTVAGALVATNVPDDWLARVLGLAAVLGAVAALGRKGMRNLPAAAFTDETPGEWPGTLGGQYPLGDRMVPYQAQRVPLGLAVSSVAGLVAGLSGVGGGFIKTPAMSEIMRVPVKVAAATTTFTLGITAATGLLIYGLQGRIDLRSGSAVVGGSLVGGILGSRFQSVVDPTAARRTTGALLIVVALVVIGRSF